MTNSPLRSDLLGGALDELVADGRIELPTYRSRLLLEFEISLGRGAELACVQASPPEQAPAMS
jgi:hypothetical protein